MKKHFLNYIKKGLEIKNYDNDKIDEIMYGVEGLYLTITKILIIFPIALILGIFKEFLLLLILYNFIRLFSFGMHANKSWQCLMFSLLIFLGGAYLSKVLIISKFILYILYFVSLLIILIYSPADTKKRPLIKKKRRIIYKLLSVLVLLIYFIISLIINNSLIINCLIIGVLIECILILPITYKIFNLSYNNYKTYDLNTI